MSSVQLIKKSGLFACLILFGFVLFTAFSASKSSALYEATSQQENQQVEISATCYQTQVLGVTESSRNGILIVFKFPKLSMIKYHVAPEFSFIAFQPLSKIDHLFSYEFLRLNILAAKHHPPTFY